VPGFSPCPIPLVIRGSCRAPRLTMGAPKARNRDDADRLPVVVASADRILHTPKHGLQSSCSTADHLTPPARPDWRRDRGFESVSLQRGVYCELDSRLPAVARPDCDRLHVRSGSCSNHSVRRRRRGRGNRRKSHAGQDWRPDCRFVSSALVWLAKVTPTSLGVALVSRVCPKTST